VDGIIEACCGPSVNPPVASQKDGSEPEQQHFRILRQVVKGGLHLGAPNTVCVAVRPPGSHE